MTAERRESERQKYLAAQLKLVLRALRKEGHELQESEIDAIRELDALVKSASGRGVSCRPGSALREILYLLELIMKPLMDRGSHKAPRAADDECREYVSDEVIRTVIASFEKGVFAGIEHCYRFVRTVTSRRLVDYSRRRGDRDHVLMERSDLEGRVVAKNFEEEIIESECSTEKRDALFSAVQGLSPVLRRVIQLHYYEGHSLWEVAGIMGISYQAARQRNARAKKILRAAVEKEGCYDYAL